MHDNILITSPSLVIDLIFLVQSWEKDGISITKNPGYSYFPLHKMDPATCIHALLLEDMGVLLYLLRHGSHISSILTQAHMYGFGSTRAYIYAISHPVMPKTTNLQ